ncbi:uncharacterized protein LOC117327384 [Pecten maximus]|uniref:uncharacterized protein LOC117327384 n=1 Tax=Pecten maximus TaxID=6579 RepID=UPI001458DF43|nr:uncharacterized protein LOC117327384 [Pecten maximus]
MHVSHQKVTVVFAWSMPNSLALKLKYSTPEKRMLTFNNDKRCSDEGFNRILADAGFYVKPKNREQESIVRLACCRCPLELRMLGQSFDPDREHARWFPTCAHVIHRMGIEFIHSVLEDTRKQQEHDDGVEN